MSNEHRIGAEEASMELMAYFDGQLPELRARAVALHMEQCDECQLLAAEFQGLSRRMRAWEVESTEGKMSPAVAAALEKHAAKANKPRRAWSWNWKWALTSIAAAIFGFGILRLTVWNPGERFAQLASSQVEEQSPRPQGVQLAQRRDQLEVGAYLEKDNSRAADLVRTKPPMIARTVQLDLIVKDVEKARAEIDSVLQRHQGYMGQLSIAGPGKGRVLQATLRIPGGQLNAALADLKKLGSVQMESQDGQEVTDEYVDLDARLSNARNSEKRLTDLLRDRTGRLSDVLSVEQQIQRVRGEIEQMDAQKKSLENRVAFASLHLTAREDDKAEFSAPDSNLKRFRNAAVDGYRSMIEGVMGLALLMLTVGPSLLLWLAVLFFPVRWAWRRWRTN